MTEPQIDVATTLFVLPADAKFLPVAELSPRLQSRIGPVEEGQSVITRPGFRTTTRLVPAALATLLREFNEPSRLTDAVLRFARASEQDPMAVLDLAFDALATLVEARILVPHDSPDASALAPSFAAGQAFAGFEIEALVRSLEDSELYRARTVTGDPIALKITRDDRAGVVSQFAHEAAVLTELGGGDTPALVAHGTSGGRAYVAMEWCEGVSIAVAAQQARAARNRSRLQQLVTRMLKTYGRLHARGFLHGDIHHGNCLVGDDGRVVLVDFGNARRVGAKPNAGSALEQFDLGRTGIPQFHDPQMAAALLAGRLPPPGSPASEQYAIAVLAYLLVTGLHPLDAPAIHDELLRHIVTRPPLPFPARGVPAWPAVERVLRRALAKDPGDRFPDVAAFAAAFASAELFARRDFRCAAAVQQAFDAAVDQVSNLAQGGPSIELVWFGLRAALVLEDPELIAAADLLARELEGDWASQAAVAHVARARSDRRLERASIGALITDADGSSDDVQTASALLAAAGILEGGAFRTPDTARLAGWCAQQVDRLLSTSDDAAADDTQSGDLASECLRLTAALSIVRAGVVTVPADLPRRLDSLFDSGGGNVWLWSCAYDVLGEERFKQRAQWVELPSAPLVRAFALLRLHQLTGEMEWVSRAEHVLTDCVAQLTLLKVALLVAELRSPETALLPPYAGCLESLGADGAS